MNKIDVKMKNGEFCQTSNIWDQKKGIQTVDCYPLPTKKKKKGKMRKVK